MTITLEQVEKMLDAEGLHYFVDPARQAAALFIGGINGVFQLVVHVDMKGEFMQFRTLGYLRCPPSHPHRAALLSVLAALNYQVRFAKLGWSPSDGELVVYGDMWITDGAVTQEQFRRMLHNFFMVLDGNHPRFVKILETGKDPGVETPQQILEKLELEGGLPEALRTALEKLTGGEGKKPGGTEEPPEIEKI